MIMESKSFRKERRILGGKAIDVRVPAKPFLLTEKEKREVSQKISKKMGYWKKHDKEKYKEAMRAIKMAEGKTV